MGGTKVPCCLPSSWSWKDQGRWARAMVIEQHLPSTAVHRPSYEMSVAVWTLLEDALGTGSGCSVNTLAWPGKMPVSQVPSSPCMEFSFLGEELALLGLAVLTVPVGCRDTCYGGNSFFCGHSHPINVSALSVCSESQRANP